MDKIYETTEFSRKFFPKIEVRFFAEARDGTPYAFNADKGGYRYHFLAISRITIKTMDKYGFWDVSRNFLYASGWIADGFKRNAVRDAENDCAAEYVFWEQDGENSFYAAWNKIMSKIKNQISKTFEQGEKPNGTFFNVARISNGFCDAVPEFKPPLVRELVCGTNMLERDGFIEGCSYEGAIPQIGDRGYVLVRDDSNAEKLLPAEFFRVGD